MAEIKVDMARIPEGVKKLALLAMDPHYDGFVSMGAVNDLKMTKKYIEDILAQLSETKAERREEPMGPGSSGSEG